MDEKSWFAVGVLAGVLLAVGLACLGNLVDEVFDWDEDRS